MKKALLLCFLLPICLLAVKVEVSVNKYTLSTSDQLELTLKISDVNRVRVSEPQPPAIPLFTYRNMTSSSSSSVELIGTKLISQFSETYRYIYFPTKTGTSNIPSISVKVNGRNYSTRPINLTVVKGTTPAPHQTTPPLPGFNPFGADEPDFWNQPANLDDNTRLLALPESQYVYKGFPAIVSYYIYTDTMVRSFNLEDEKDFSGYGKSTYEQPTMLNYENVTLGGKPYKRALIKRLAVIPNQEGSLQAPLLSGNARLYNFGYLNKNLVSSGGNIVVRPLPKDNVPQGFAGAVGNFKISHSISKKELSLGEAITFTLKITGKGNFNQFTAPLFPSGQGFQVSAPMVIDNLNAGIEGSRTYYYTLIPQDKGKLTMPDLRFVWFGNESGSYQVYHSPKEQIEVSSAHVLSYFNRLWEPKNQRSMFPKIERTSYPPFNPIASQPWYWLLIVIILAGTACVAFFALEAKLKSQNPESFARKKADKVLQRYMKQALVAAQNLSQEFYPLAETAIMNYLAAKYKLANRLSTAEKLAALQELNIPQTLLTELNEFLLHCQAARYMPESERAVNLQEDLQSAKNLISGFVRLTRKAKRESLL